MTHPQEPSHLSSVPETPSEARMPRFVPLHLHSHYTLLEGTSRVSELLKMSHQAGCPAMALTDHGVMYGSVEMVSTAEKYGMKPIIGCELSIVEGDYTDKRTRQTTYRLVLLAQTDEGYKNLVKLSSIGNLEGFYYRPRINWDLLMQHSDGLIALTGDLTGPIAHHVLRGQQQAAEERLVWLKALFGDRLYLEIQDHGMESEQQVNQVLVRMADQYQVPLVICHDIRFNHAEDRVVHELLQCLKDGKTLNDPSRSSFYNEHYYFKTPETLYKEGFQYLSRERVFEAMEHSFLISERVSFKLPLGQTFLPDYPMSEEDIAAGKTSEDLLKEVATRYALEKYGDPLRPEVQDRLDYELTIINQMGFPTYFLIVWDFINYARTQGIPVGPGRGSAAGSLVAYVLGITNLDPIEHSLLFERFLNPERISMPDVDIDFCIERRSDVIDYVTRRYGRERVCQIATFGTLAARASVKAVARVKEVPFAESDRLAKMIPSTPGVHLEDALKDGMPLAVACAENPEVQEIVTLARKLEGLAFNIGIHAAGVVISKDPLMDILPLQLGKEKANQSSGPPVITQCPMGDVEKIGLLKMDFLGLRNLTIIHQALNHIERLTGERPDLDRIPLDDKKVYDLLTRADTDGVFQLESGGMKALVSDLKPSVFEDINALVALYRPGPLNSGMAKKFVDRKHGREAVVYPHEKLEPILSSTYGTIVYQEQIMQIAQSLAGYSLGGADLLRRAMGKKKPEIMEKERANFVKGGIAQGVDEALLNELFDTMSEFAAYCFNRSHSAAYGFVAYQTAYLKAHYPVAYLSALLSSVSSDIEKIQFYLLTARRMGIKVLSPDVCRSAVDFQPEGEDSIRFGLASIKGVGEGVILTLIDERERGGMFTSLSDFFKRIPSKILNRKTLEGLILGGAFDSLHPNRKQLFDSIEQLVKFSEKCHKEAESGQVSLFSMVQSQQETTDTFTGLQLQGSPHIDFPEEERQAHEKALMGFYVSSHPLDFVRDQLPLYVTHWVSQLKEADEGEEVVVAGLLQSFVVRFTKTNRKMILATLEDLTGSVECVVFGDAQVDTLASQLKEGQCVVLHARVQFRGGTPTPAVSIATDTEDETPTSTDPSTTGQQENITVNLVLLNGKPLRDAHPMVVRFGRLPQEDDIALMQKVFRATKPTLPEEGETAKKPRRPWGVPESKRNIRGLHPLLFVLPFHTKHPSSPETPALHTSSDPLTPQPSCQIVQADTRFWLSALPSTPQDIDTLHQACAMAGAEWVRW
ncbi:MAG: DNA polymerase III subunit alpha [Vampirovibrionales bacterium]